MELVSLSISMSIMFHFFILLQKYYFFSSLQGLLMGFLSFLGVFSWLPIEK
jgi:hypothetical protein